MKKTFILLMSLLAMMAAGVDLKAQEITITLVPEWNWICYPNAVAMEIDEALGDFVPMEGDRIKSQTANSIYSSGRWRGAVTHFIPGRGYMYYSARTESISFTFAKAPSSIVTTSEPTDITTTSAVVGGTITLPEGSHVFLRGVCWGTTPNPDIDDDHTSEEPSVGVFNSTLEGLEPGTTYYVRAYAVTDYGLDYGEELSFTTLVEYAYVDLGLPSGTLWATCNVGANAPEEYGDYFAWGETQPKDNYDWSTYQYCMGSNNTLTKYCSVSDFGYNGFTDALTILLPEDDAATANWGADWRMPTAEEWQELHENTYCSWTQENEVNGWRFTASNGNSIFLPAAGYRNGDGLFNAGSRGDYKSSSLNTDVPNYAWYLYFNSDYYGVYSRMRDFGQSVRPVRSSAQNNAPTGAINGKFTINDNGDQVYFSQGNLQYQASTNTWKFAENQYDYIGDANSNISSTYEGWIDFFGWGTSGYHDSNDPYNVNYQPWSSSDSELDNDYNTYGYGPSANMPDMNLTGTSANYDWGVNNPISNGGNAANQWRTLTLPEWNYVLDTRNTPSGIRFARAQVNNVNGVILLPDDWTTDTYNLNNTNSIGATYSSNVINASQWVTIENAGGVFLPDAGGRFGTTVADVGSTGFYWLSSSESSCCAYYVLNSDIGIYNVNYRRYLGRSVRLVSDVE